MGQAFFEHIKSKLLYVLCKFFIFFYLYIFSSNVNINSMQISKIMFYSIKILFFFYSTIHFDNKMALERMITQSFSQV